MTIGSSGPPESRLGRCHAAAEGSGSTSVELTFHNLRFDVLRRSAVLGWRRSATRASTSRRVAVTVSCRSRR